MRIPDTARMASLPRLDELMQLSVEVRDTVSLGATTAGERRLAPITGGRFETPNGGCGRVLPSSADWQWQRAVGVLEVDARHLLEDESGAGIQVVSRGLQHGPPEVIALARGDAVDPSRYCFRTAMRFEASVPQWRCLNLLLAVGIGIREPHLVRLGGLCAATVWCCFGFFDAVGAGGVRFCWVEFTLPPPKEPWHAA